MRKNSIKPDWRDIGIYIRSIESPVLLGKSIMGMHVMDGNLSGWAGRRQQREQQSKSLDVFASRNPNLLLKWARVRGEKKILHLVQLTVV